MIPSRDFWRGRRVLLTGHTGFKGAWLSMWLDALGAEVTGLALPCETDADLFATAGVERRLGSHVGDVRDPAVVEGVMHEAQPEIVLHLAAQALVRRSYADPVGTYATNVMGTAHVLDAVRRVESVRAVVVVTSDKCYENREWWWAYREDEALGGHDPYSSSKSAAELVTSAWRRSFFSADEPRVGVATARAGNVIGGGDWAEDRLVPDCVRAFARGAPAIIRRPDSVRPWQHVLEPLCGYLTLAEHLVAEPGRFADAWNFGPAVTDARPVSWVVERLARSWGDDAQWVRDGGSHPHEAGVLQVDASKARAALGWRPRLGIEESLTWTVDWYRRVGSGEDAAALTLEQIAQFEKLEEDGSS